MKTNQLELMLVEKDDKENDILTNEESDRKNIAEDEEIIKLAQKIGCRSNKYIECKMYIKAWWQQIEEEDIIWN